MDRGQQAIDLSNTTIVNNLASYEIPSNIEGFKKYAFENGSECLVYYPPNITADTKVTNYFPGGGGTVKNLSTLSVHDYVAASGSDQIVVIPYCKSRDWYYRSCLAAKMTTVLEEEYNLNSRSHSWAGHSDGGPRCLEAPVAYQTINPNAGPQIAVSVDGFAELESDPWTMYHNYGEKFKENNNILITIEQGCLNRNHNNKTWSNYYAERGINVLKVVFDKDSYREKRKGNGEIFKEYCGEWAHDTINQEYYREGFMEFMANNGGKLPSEGYYYQVWDNNIGDWKVIDVSEVATYTDLMRYFGNDVSGPSFSVNPLIQKLTDLKNLEDLVVKSDDVSLQNALNSVRHCVKSSSCVQQGMPTMSCSSTTAVPSKIGSVVCDYFNMAADLLALVANQTETFVGVYNSINGIDEEIEDDSEELVPEFNGLATELSEIDKTNPNSDKNNDIDLNTDDLNKNNNVNSDSTIDVNSNTSTQENNNQENKNPHVQIPVGGNDNGGGHAPSPYVPPSTHSGGSPSIHSGDGGTTPRPEPEITDPFVDETIDFPVVNFDELKSNDNLLVYNFNNNCKIAIHSQGDKIIGLEHYYKFDSEDSLNKYYNILKNKYNSSLIENISIKDNSIRVLFDNNALKHYKLSDLKNRYSGYEIL